MGGTKDERQFFIKNDLPIDPATGKYTFDVLVTSYEGLLKEKGRFSRIEWKYLIIDEAHRIKNENSSLSLAVRIMKPQFRLLITGTPLQNNLRELWALLNFLMPDIFGDAQQFDEWFSLSDESGKENVIKKLHTILRPFMLRRVKADVAKSLPPKKETKLYVGLTEMQITYYVKCLQKDMYELNKLGGPDRNRLLNVLMQLRKVCNHPYLFDGAEQGPPYVDGPHLWENSGKMQLLHKLLPKLQAQGSRVLIFSQMTRVLDILEDYLRLLQIEYCRIDGNTDGERRDAQVDDFNSPGSTKFVFLLSTRAGGLGINLATADIVILFDSDWNPQVDLQAMDRAHRIGQQKPVHVFRFVTEGTVEEKIIERADRKLFLDAAVIQQGRLAEQNASLEKGELMKMVRFGADQILSGKGGTYTDEDIDALIARGEERTSAIQAKLETDARHSLANFSLMADDDTGKDTFSFGGKNYRDSDKNSGGNFINLPQRQRKRNYDISAAETSAAPSKKSETTGKKKQKGPSIYDFQLFDMERLDELAAKERELAAKKDEEVKLIAQMRQEGVIAPPFGSGVAQGRSKEELLEQAERREQQLIDFQLTEAEIREKEELYSEGFPDWSRKDFRAFCAGLERHGRYDFASICQAVRSETGKERHEIQRYFVSFWTNYQRIAEWPKILERIERGEKKIQRLRQIREVIHEKVERHLEDTFGPHFRNSASDKPLPTVAEMLHYSWPKMKINYGSSARGKGYQEEEDAFLVCMMYRHGYGAAERIRMEIRRAWQFRMDWYFKSRSALDIQKRCDVLVKIVERDNEEFRKKEQEMDKTEGLDALSQSERAVEGIEDFEG
jgi:SWI/SNF-related matrix-associated actin-dependent regulator of chromatin subfamily A member 5